MCDGVRVGGCEGAGQSGCPGTAHWVWAPSRVWERKRQRGEREEPGWEGAQAQGRGLVLGDPSWCTGGQGGYPQGQAIVTLWVLLEALGLALTPGKPGVFSQLMGPLGF